MADRTRPDRRARDEPIARARARLGADDDTPTDASAPSWARGRRGSTPSRILVAGAAAASALVMIGTMAADRPTAASPAPATVLVVEVPAAHPVTNPPAPGVPTPSERTTVREVRVTPAPAENPAPAPAPTEGS